MPRRSRAGRWALTPPFHPYPKTALEGPGRATHVSCFVLHRVGFFVPPHLRLGRWALTPPFHPYPAFARRFIFCDTLRRKELSLSAPPLSRGMLPCGVRTFLSVREASERPSAIARNVLAMQASCKAASSPGPACGCLTPGLHCGGLGNIAEKKPGEKPASLFDVLDRACFAFEACHFHTCDSARRDVAKRGEGTGGDVQREAVHGNPAAHSNANRGNFSVLHPNSSKSVASLAGHSGLTACADDGLFKKAHVAVKISIKSLEVQNGIGDELPRAVPGGLAAAVDFENRVGQGGAFMKTGPVTGASDCIDWLVFKQEQPFGSTSVEVLLNVGLLEP